MTTSEQTMAGPSELGALAKLAHSDQPFLTLYLNTEQESVPRNVHARVIDLLWAGHEKYAGGQWADFAARERERVLPMVPTLKPIGSGLVIVSSGAVDLLETYWLPGPVDDHIRVGRGVDALPLLDLIDEYEPIGVAFVENDKARLIVTSAGRVLHAEHYESDVPGKENAGGWRNAGYDRHRLDHVHRHLKSVAEALAALHRRQPFERLFLGGPTEPLAMFHKELSPELEHIVVGEIGIDAHSSNDEIAQQVLPRAEAVERDVELKLVNEIITSAEKGHGAVVGVDATLAALNDHEAHILVLDPSVEIKAGLCPACDRLIPAASLRCPVCEGAVVLVDLREELPSHLPEGHPRLELVHGEAAAALWDHGSIGATLQVHAH